MYDDFANWKFLEFSKSGKLSNFENLIIFEIGFFPNRKFLQFASGNFWSCPNWKVFEFSKVEILEICRIRNLRNFLNSKINKFIKLYDLKN